MLGFPFKATWDSPKSTVPMTASGTYNLASFHAAPFIPPYEMFHGFGNQNSTNLSPMSTNMVPAQNGIFGPLFGNIGPGTCPANASIGPLFAPVSRGPPAGTLDMSRMGFPVMGGAFPDPESGRCKPHQDDPY
jgi:hypothetical protein